MNKDKLKLVSSNTTTVSELRTILDDLLIDARLLLLKVKERNKQQEENKSKVKLKSV